MRGEGDPVRSIHLKDSKKEVFPEGREVSNVLKATTYLCDPDQINLSKEGENLDQHFCGQNLYIWS